MTGEAEGPAWVEELRDAPEPVEALARLAGLPGCVLLESAARMPRLGRYSFLSADPFARVVGRGAGVEVTGVAPPPAGDALEALRAALARFPLRPAPGLPPWQGGAAGYLAYDLAWRLERLPDPRHDDLALPDVWMGVYDWTLAWDHEAARCWLVSTGVPEGPGPARAERARARATEVLRRLSGPAPRPPATPPAPRPAPPAPPTHPVPGRPGVRSTFSREGYLAAVERVRAYIRAGDLFQANLTQRLEAPLAGPPLELYRRLRELNPAPFAAYLDAGEAVLLGSSPERFLRLDGRAVETRPIKGTAPRHPDPARDAAGAAALRASDKDRAENVMIVDLLRNDLSRVCTDDSVRVPELCALESYARVHHLVSAVTGELRPECGAAELLRAAFPGGSITGAPKVRAMEVLAELEPTRRGPYTGALGWIGFDGSMDSCISIRTLVARGGRVTLGAGGGVTLASDPAREYEETLDKAGALLAALEAGDGAADR